MRVKASSLDTQVDLFMCDKQRVTSLCCAVVRVSLNWTVKYRLNYKLRYTSRYFREQIGYQSPVRVGVMVTTVIQFVEFGLPSCDAIRARRGTLRLLGFPIEQ